MKRFILLCALLVICSSAAFAQEDKVTQGVVTTTTNTTYTTVTQTKQVRMSDEQWAEYKRQQKLKRQARRDSIAAISQARRDSMALVNVARYEADSAKRVANAALAQERRVANALLAKDRNVVTGDWKNYVNINLSGVSRRDGGGISTPSIGIEYIGGKRFNRVVFLGFGTGIVFNTATDSGQFYSGSSFRDKDLGLCVASFPLYANFRLYMAREKCQPYFSLSTGFRFSGKKSEQIHTHDILSSSQKTKFLNTTYNVEYGTTQYFLSPGFGIDFLGKSGKGVSLQASLFAITRPWMDAVANDYGKLYVNIDHSMGVGYHVQIGFTF
jgi:hypothetical protein